MICPPCEGIVELLKGAGRRNSLSYPLQGNELVAAAKSAGLSPIFGGELRRNGLSALTEKRVSDCDFLKEVGRVHSRPALFYF